MHTSTSSANRWKKYRNNSLVLSLSLSLFLDNLVAFLHSSFVLLLRLEVSTSIITTTSITYIYYSLWSLSSVRQAANATSVQARFCFTKKKGIGLLDVDVDVLSSVIEHFSCSCLCVVLCVAGRYCFRLIAAVVVDFSLLLFTHTHTCRSFSFPVILLPKKEKREIFLFFIYIYIYILVLILSSFFSSSSFSSYVITHPFLLLQSYVCVFVAYLFFLIIKKETFFYFPSFFFWHTQTNSIFHRISSEF